jgi:hypothetical protein
MAKPLTNIVFTRNRPLQLAGYLDSFFRHMGPVAEQVFILYKKDSFVPEYDRVFAEFPQCRVVEEADFHDDFLSVVDQIDTEYVVFGTDDMVYFDSVDFSLIDTVYRERGDLFAFTMKIGSDHYADGKEPIEAESIGGQAVYKVNWQTATDRLSGYPFEVSMTIYRKAFIREILRDISRERPWLKKLLVPNSPALAIAGLFVKRKRILRAINTFHGPNQLEGYGYHWCRKNKSRLAPYVYFQRICAATLQVNQVNTVVANPVYGGEDLSAKTLNERFREGYRLDTRYLEEHKPAFPLVGHEYFRLVNKNTT